MGLDALVRKAKRTIGKAHTTAQKKLAEYKVQVTSAASAQGRFIPIAPLTFLAGAYYALANAPERCFTLMEECSNPDSSTLYKAVAGAVVAGFSLADVLMREPGMIRKGMIGFTIDKRATHTNELSGIKSRYGTLIDQLTALEIPEEAIEQHRGLWETLLSVERNGVVSHNATFKVQDRDGRRWLLKMHRDKARATMEAAANYYLGNHFSFIVPGMAPTPLEANGLYFTMQEDVSGSSVIHPRTPQYWMAALGLFHRDAARILGEEGITLVDAPLRDRYNLQELVEKGKDIHGLHIDRRMMEDAVAYLQESPCKTPIHGDLKRDNRLGPYMVDLEGLGFGHPGRDIALVLMQAGVPREKWDNYLHLYLHAKGTKDSYDEEFLTLQEGMNHAAVYVAVKEIAGSSLREIMPATRKDNHQLAGALAAYA